jgi:FKBP-type peptidyl-prolyl cis-trans isomerase FkpA
MKLPLVLGVLAVATTPIAWFSLSPAPVAVSAERPRFALLDTARLSAQEISGLEVVTWEEKFGKERRFAIRRDGEGAWTIPSKFSYPADDNAKVTEISQRLIQVERGRKVEAAADRLADLGVLDPTDPQTGAAAEAYGRRIILTDRTGAQVLDVIIGKAVVGAAGLRYVRPRGGSEVWTAKIDADISLRFTDYVQTDPFKIVRDEVRAVGISDYTVDQEKLAITPRSETSFVRVSSTTPWTSAQTPEGKTPVATKVDAILSELGSLRLIDVRPVDQDSFRTSGIFIQPDAPNLPLNPARIMLGGQRAAVYGTEGRIDVSTRDGLVYQFMFGGTATIDDDGDGTEDAGAAKARIVAVYVRHDPALDESPVPATASKAILRKSGAERAARAQSRYDRFFYVISDSAFKNLRPEAATLFEDLPKPAATMAVEAGFTTTASGLQWREDRPANEGARKPGPTDTVTVHYRGTLVSDGSEFDSSYGRGQPASFPLNGVIKGWTEGLQLMGEGAKYTFIIPSDLAYGDAGSPPKIPAKATLRFEVELLSVK